MALIPTQNRGEFQISELGKKIRLTEWEEMDIYDTIALVAGAALVGGYPELNFFQNIQGKRRIDTNLRTNGKVLARHEVIVMKPSVFVTPMWGIIGTGLADQAAATPPLLIPFVLDPDDDVVADVRFNASNAGLPAIGGAAPAYVDYVLANDTAIKSFLHGFVKSPATK